MDRLNLVLLLRRILERRATQNVWKWSEISKMQTPLLIFLLVIFV